MTPPRRLPCLLAPLLVGLTLAAAGCSRHKVPDAAADGSIDAMGEPKFTPDLYYRTGQLAEASSLDVGQNGQPLPPAKARQYEMTALQNYDKALELDPRHAPTLYSVAVLRGRRGEHDKAVEAWKRYADAVGRTPASLTNLAVALEQAGRPADAEKAYAAAIAADPAFKPARVNLGVLLAKQGRILPAKKHLSAVLEPAAVEWHLGAALQAAGQMPAAEDHYRAAAALDPAYAVRPDFGATAKVE